MTIMRRHGNWVIVLSLLIALLLTLLPLPAWAAPYRPDWVALVLIYWCLALPERVNVGIGWSMGLLLDGMSGTLLGQHALGLTVVTFLTAKLHQRIRLFPIWQQSLTVMLLLGVNQMMVLWVSGILGRPPHSWLYWAPTLSGLLLWPWMYGLLRDLRRRFKVT